MELLPEKHYEACLTYHMIEFYKNKYGKKIYPFSISQIQEKEKGFDFGYQIEQGTIFFVQYKRPAEFPLCNGSFRWEINIEQLQTILDGGIGNCTYYALPAFFRISDWYEGLEMSWFIRADHLWAQLRILDKLKEKTVRINEKQYRLQQFSEIFGQESYWNVLCKNEYERNSFCYEKLLEDKELCGYFIQ